MFPGKRPGASAPTGQLLSMPTGLPYLLMTHTSLSCIIRQDLLGLAAPYPPCSCCPKYCQTSCLYPCSGRFDIPHRNRGGGSKSISRRPFLYGKRTPGIPIISPFGVKIKINTGHDGIQRIQRGDVVLVPDAGLIVIGP